MVKSVSPIMEKAKRPSKGKQAPSAREKELERVLVVVRDELLKLRGELGTLKRRLRAAGL